MKKVSKFKLVKRIVLLSSFMFFGFMGVTQVQAMGGTELSSSIFDNTVKIVIFPVGPDGNEIKGYREVHEKVPRGSYVTVPSIPGYVPDQSVNANPDLKGVQVQAPEFHLGALDTKAFIIKYSFAGNIIAVDREGNAIPGVEKTPYTGLPGNSVPVPQIDGYVPLIPNAVISAQGGDIFVPYDKTAEPIKPSEPTNQSTSTEPDVSTEPSSQTETNIPTAPSNSIEQNGSAEPSNVTDSDSKSEVNHPLATNASTNPSQSAKENSLTEAKTSSSNKKIQKTESVKESDANKKALPKTGEKKSLVLSLLGGLMALGSGFIFKRKFN